MYLSSRNRETSQCHDLEQDQPRVVVERLDSLGNGDCCQSDSVLCSDDGSGTITAPSFPALSITQQQQHALTPSPIITPSPSLTLTCSPSLNLSSVAVEEETYSRLGINLDDADMMAMQAQEEDKWTQSLVDLFPELD